MMPHSPTPWHASNVFRTDGNHPGIDIGAESGANIAMVHYARDEMSLAEVRANACVIAAAPELLAACQAIIRAIREREDGGFDVIGFNLPRAAKLAHAAIAKAKGVT